MRTFNKKEEIRDFVNNYNDINNVEFKTNPNNLVHQSNMINIINELCASDSTEEDTIILKKFLTMVPMYLVVFVLQIYKPSPQTFDELNLKKYILVKEVLGTILELPRLQSGNLTKFSHELLNKLSIF